MLDINVVSKEDELTKHVSREEFIDFLHLHLDRFRDSKYAIGLSVDYAFSDEGGKGGFLVTAHLDGKLAGALVMNKTGMEDYIPEYLLVYIAVDSSLRGRGIGKKIIDKAKEMCDGNIKLHVEYDNPAKRLYEREGFTSKYAEMRFVKQKK